MKKLLFLCIGICTPLFCFSQNWEIGIMLGASNYEGDLSASVITIPETHPAGGAFLRYNVNKQFTLKGSIYYGAISGNDANSSNPDRIKRNLSFRSSVLEFAATGEYNIGGYQVESRSNRFAPYLFAGIGVFRFNPEAYYPPGKEWVALQPLGTEGQETTRYNDREKYSLTQVSIPFGAGFKFNFSGAWSLGFEAGTRKTFTDYLDDVSKTYVNYDYLRAAHGELAANLSNRTGEIPPYQRKELDDKTLRGNPAANDWYLFAGFTLSYTLIPNTCYEF